MAWPRKRNSISNKYLRFFTFLENVCRGSGDSPRGPMGHLSDENEALGLKNPFVMVLMPGFDENIWKKYKKAN